MTDPARAICAELCEPDPPCYVLDEDDGKVWTPCTDCLRACGVEVPEPLDPAAVVRPLL